MRINSGYGSDLAWHFELVIHTNLLVLVQVIRPMDIARCGGGKSGRTSTVDSIAR